MLDTLLTSSDFADRLLQLGNAFDDKSKQLFRDNCFSSWDSWTRQSVIVPLGEAKHHIDDMPNNWLYDRKSGLVWVNLQGGMHSTMMASLFLLHNGATDIRDWTMEDADHFVMKAHGMYLSSVSKYSCKGIAMELTRQEKIVFSNARLRNLDEVWD